MFMLRSRAAWNVTTGTTSGIVVVFGGQIVIVGEYELTVCRLVNRAKLL